MSRSFKRRSRCADRAYAPATGAVPQAAWRIEAKADRPGRFKWPHKLTPRVSPPTVSSATLVRGRHGGDFRVKFAVGRGENTVAYRVDACFRKPAGPAGETHFRCRRITVSESTAATGTLRQTSGLLFVQVKTSSSLPRDGQSSHAASVTDVCRIRQREDKRQRSVSRPLAHVGLGSWRR